MSTTFAVKLKSGEQVDIARRSNGLMWFTNDIAEMLPDETPVHPTDNSAQGIYTIGDIRKYIQGDDLEKDTSWIKDPSKIEMSQRASIFVRLDDAWHKEHHYLEVTEWTNGEGWDITISDDKQFSLHFTEFAVLKELIERLENR